MVDSHCHLADDAFTADLDDVVSRARSAGVESVLCVLDAGSEVEIGRAPGLRERWGGVRFAVGVHPHQAGRYAQDAAEAVRVAAGAIDGVAGACGLGEIGLDYHYDFAPRAVQQAVFAAQVDLAVSRNLPVVIHTREADADTVAILRGAGPGRVRGVFHCFTGDAALARAALDLGFHVSFAGIVSFPKAQALRDVAATVPEDRLLIETDSPFLAPVPHRGKRNEPAWVARVCEVLAGVRGVAPGELADRTSRNFAALFEPSRKPDAGPSPGM
jgi:TatD DNase family protein